MQVLRKSVFGDGVEFRDIIKLSNLSNTRKAYWVQIIVI